MSAGILVPVLLVVGVPVQAHPAGVAQDREAISPESVLREEALALALTGDPAALKALETAAKTSKDPDIFFRLGWLRAHQGDRWGACAAWEAGARELGAWVLWDSARQLKCGIEPLPIHRVSLPNAPASPPLPTELDRSPYLQDTRPTSSTIVWRTVVESTGEVRWGDSVENLDRTTPSPATARQHEVTLADLAPDSRTFYAVYVNGQQVAGGEDHFVQTPPVTGTRSPLRVWVVGDSGTGKKRPEMVMDGLLEWAGEALPYFALHLGDMAHMDGTDEEFTANYYDMYASILGRVTVWPAIGNHEGHSLSSATQTGPYFEGYVLPADGSAGGIASGTEAYYSFDLANAHFVVLDTHDSSRDPAGAQMTWLAADLTANESEWTVASFHHAPYSQGHLDSDLFEKMIEAREWVLPILEEGGVDLVLAGHSHTFERSYLLDGGYETPATDAAILDPRSGWAAKDEIYVKPAENAGRQGTIYVTAGHGGSPVGGAGGHPVHCYEERENGSLVVDIHENRMTLTNVRLDGSVTDKATLVKGDALVVTAPDGGEAWLTGETQTVRWTTVGEVASVDLEWSCNGGESWLPVAEDVENTGSMEWTAPSEATDTALVRVRSTGSHALGDQSNGMFSVGTEQTVRILDHTDPWRIHDSGADPGSDWMMPSFDDSGWRLSPELDGCRRGRALCPLQDSAGVHRSYLLRHTFELDKLPESARMEVLLEDGLVLWLNGTEIFAHNVDLGTHFDDWASSDSLGSSFTDQQINRSLLVEGENVLAAMVKQAGQGTSQLDFRGALDVVLVVEAETQVCPPAPLVDTGLETGEETGKETAVDSGTDGDTSGPSKDHRNCGCGRSPGRPGAWLILVGAFAGMTRRRQSSFPRL